MGHIATRRERSLPAHALLALLGACLTGAALLAGCADDAYYDAGYYDTGTVYSVPQVAAPQPQQLDQLVAPIALYPDPLVAQILAASTYPAEIVEAQRWMGANTALTGDARAKAADQRAWDPSVKSLTQFPEVLAMMDTNLSWTSALGEAYMSDSAAVMDAVQRLRQRAQAAGNLKSTPQENVATENGDIEIEPVNSGMVYVPAYDPWIIYGEPIGIWPGWLGYPGLYFAGPGILFPFGAGIYAGFGWGWPFWHPNWHGHGIWYRNGPWRSGSPAFWGHHPGLAGAPGRGPGFGRPGGPARGGMRSGAFSGFNHGGVAGGFSSRGRASVGGGGFRGGGGGGGRGGGRR